VLTKAIAVFGYNNTRIDDVKQIREIALRCWNAQVLLIKEGISPIDRDVTPYCLDHKPEDPYITPTLKSYLNAHDLELIGCLPFSDKGVIGAAHVSKAFNLFGDDTDTAEAMLHKGLFRQLEAQIELDETAYKKPFYKIVFSAEELEGTFRDKGTYFIKPLTEGNSRGCMTIDSAEAIQTWLSENDIEKGAICEELLARDNEYTFDGVDGSYWIGEKFTTKGPYRAEYQHIMPAPLGASQRQQVHQTLEPLLQKLGSNGGAFHHEFFILEDGRIASVEPNRRPAGMWWWDVAAKTFKDFTSWQRWVDLCVSGRHKPQALEAKRFGGIRGVISRTDGRLTSVNRRAIETELKQHFGASCFRFAFTKEHGAQVTSTPRDNSGFIACLAMWDPSYQQLLKNLSLAEEIILSNTVIS